MFREIKKKKVVLGSRAPFSPEVLREAAGISTEDFIYTNLRLEGSGLLREDVASILAGNVKKEMTIADHQLMERLRGLKEEMTGMIEMQTSMNLRTLRRLYAIIAGVREQEVRYRGGFAPAESIAYSVPSPDDISEQMDILADEMAHPEEWENELQAAAFLHCRLLEICPFEEYNGILARTALYYYMMSFGYPIFAFNFSKDEYDRAMLGYLKDENIREFYGGLERSLYNKMEQLLELTGKRPENGKGE